MSDNSKLLKLKVGVLVLLGLIISATLFTTHQTTTITAAGAASSNSQSFLEFESGPVRPLAMSPDGTKLFAVNTPNNTLEIFRLTPRGLVLSN